MTEQTLREIYARHFEMVVQDGAVGCIMASYNKVNGVKATQNPHLLQKRPQGACRAERLRATEGLVITDWWAMPGDQAVPDSAIAQSVTTEAVFAGPDIEVPWTLHYSESTLAQADQSLVKDSAQRVLTQKYRFKSALSTDGWSLKAPASTMAGGSIDPNSAGGAANELLAEEAELKSAVLLNNGPRWRRPCCRSRTSRPSRWSARNSRSSSSARPHPELRRHRRQPDWPGPDGHPQVYLQVRDGPCARGSRLEPRQRRSRALRGSACRHRADRPVGRDGLAGVQQPSGRQQALTPSSWPSATHPAMKARSTRSRRAVIARPSICRRVRTRSSTASSHSTSARSSSSRLGSVVNMPWLAHSNKSQATIWAGYPGQRGALALGKLIFGAANFSGKMPMAWPTQAELDKQPFKDERGSHADGLLLRVPRVRSSAEVCRPAAGRPDLPVRSRHQLLDLRVLERDPRLSWRARSRRTPSSRSPSTSRTLSDVAGDEVAMLFVKPPAKPEGSPVSAPGRSSRASPKSRSRRDRRSSRAPPARPRSPPLGRRSERASGSSTAASTRSWSARTARTPRRRPTRSPCRSPATEPPSGSAQKIGINAA